MKQQREASRATRLADLIETVSNHLKATEEHVACEAGLQPRDLVVLAFLQSAASVSVNDVRERFNLTPGTTTRTLDALESRGFATRLLDPADRRSFKLLVTRRGVELTGRWRTALEEGAQRLLEPLPAEGQAALIALLERSVETLREV